MDSRIDPKKAIGASVPLVPWLNQENLRRKRPACAVNLNSRYDNFASDLFDSENVCRKRDACDRQTHVRHKRDACANIALLEIKKDSGVSRSPCSFLFPYAGVIQIR